MNLVPKTEFTRINNIHNLPVQVTIETAIALFVNNNIVMKDPTTLATTNAFYWQIDT